jgi:hypothetical protein
MSVRLWLRTVLLRRRLEREMQEEMAAHLEHATERLMARGLSREEARRMARREFGNVEYLQEQGRDARGARWVEAVVADLRFGARHFARVPFTTLTMIVVLVLGISANSGLFIFIHSAMTQPPPAVPRSDELVRVRTVYHAEGGSIVFSREVAYPELLEYGRRREVFSQVAGETVTEVVLDFGGAERQPVGAQARYVTDNYFQTLGDACAGRGDQSQHVAAAFRRLC